MTPDEFRQAFEAFWERVNAEAIAAKSSHEAYEKLRLLYAQLDAQERSLATSLPSGSPLAMS